jgi:(p)ppGpp synthase/HD superfamily hydrolase
LNEQELTPKFTEALVYAAMTHRGQLRKGTNGSYLGHLLGVTGIVIDSGGTETEAIAAVLHDAAEDCGGQPRLDDIRKLFGDAVADIVGGCSDALVEYGAEKPSWKDRKLRYIAHLRESTKLSVYLVSCADKLHNARAILSDYIALGDDLWGRFNKSAGRDGVLWYYNQMVETYANGPADPRRVGILRQLKETVAELGKLVAQSGVSP